MEGMVATVVRNAWAAMFWQQQQAQLDRQGRFYRAGRKVIMANRFTRGARAMVDGGSSWSIITRDVSSTLLWDVMMNPLDMIANAATIEPHRSYDMRVPVPWKGTVNGLRHLWSADGWRMFTRGALPATLATLLRTIPDPATTVEDELAEEGAVLSWWHACVAAVPRVVVGLIVHPLELIVTRMHTFAAPEYDTMAGAFRAIVAGEGWQGLYKGYGLSLLGDLLTYDDNRGGRLLDVMPWFSLVRVLQMTDREGNRSALSIMGDIWEKKGLSGFLSGTRAVLWSMPLILVAYGAEELLVRVLFGPPSDSRRRLGARVLTAVRRTFF